MTHAFKIVMMSKEEIKINPDEIPKVLTAITSGNPCILNQGIFNPSVFSHLVKDVDREMIKETDNFGHYTGKNVPKELENIFADIKVLVQLKSVEVKRLKS